MSHLHSFLVSSIMATGLLVAPAIAGPISSPIPTNTCPSGKPFKLIWVANGASTDFGGTACPGVGAGCAETMVVCKNTGKLTGPTMDIAVELFDASGASVGSAATTCSIGGGAGASFVTAGSPLGSPYIGTSSIGAGPVVPPGSLRVLSTIPGKTACDVTLFDTQGPASTSTTGPAWATGLTITKKKAPQKGD